jgi:hypothetical protein
MTDHPDLPVAKRHLPDVRNADLLDEALNELRDKGRRASDPALRAFAIVMEHLSDAVNGMNARFEGTEQKASAAATAAQTAAAAAEATRCELRAHVVEERPDEVHKMLTILKRWVVFAVLMQVVSSFAFHFDDLNASFDTILRIPWIVAALQQATPLALLGMGVAVAVWLGLPIPADLVERFRLRQAGDDVVEDDEKGVITGAVATRNGTSGVKSAADGDSSGDPAKLSHVLNPEPSKVTKEV